MKKALYQGNMNDFLRILGGRSDNREVPFYYTLATLMQEGEQALDAGDEKTYEAALDKFMKSIDDHFSNGGAYSLDMTNF